MQLRSNPSKLQQFMLLQSLCKRHRIEIAICSRRILERFIIFLLNVEFIESIINSFNVSRLDGDKVRFDKWDIVRLFKHAHHTSMIDTRRENREKISEKSRMFLKIKVERSVINLEIRRFHNNLFERVMFLLSVIK